MLADLGLQIEVLGRDELIRREPALSHAGSKIAGGVFSPTDQTGDCCAFTRRLAEWCETHAPVSFRYETTITGLETEGRMIKSVLTDKGPIGADAYVLAMGCDSPWVAEKLGVFLPIYPVKGYSVTFGIPKASKGRCMGGVDEDKLIAYSRLGNRLRVACTAEFAGNDRTPHPGRFRPPAGLCAGSVPRAREGRRDRILGGPQADDAVVRPDPRPLPRHAISTSTPATAMWAGPWPAARQNMSPTGWPAASRRSTPRVWKSADSTMDGPQVTIHLDTIEHNARVVERCRAAGIKVFGVTKGTCGMPQVARAMLRGGVVGLAESRFENIRRLRESGIDAAHHAAALAAPVAGGRSDPLGRCQPQFGTRRHCARYRASPSAWGGCTTSS